jgi:hypothetical protein
MEKNKRRKEKEGNIESNKEPKKKKKTEACSSDVRKANLGAA